MGVPRNAVAGQAGGAIGTRWRPTVASMSLVVAARTNAPVTIDGDYVITAGCVAQSAGQRMFIVAYRLGATGKLPRSAGS